MSASDVSHACPPFFRALCRNAVLGGGVSYRAVGQGLGAGLNELFPDQAGDSTGNSALAQLQRLVHLPAEDAAAPPAECDVDGVWSWFTAHLPECLVLVPAHQKQSFVAGVQQAFDDGMVRI